MNALVREASLLLRSRTALGAFLLLTLLASVSVAIGLREVRLVDGTLPPDLAMSLGYRAGSKRIRAGKLARMIDRKARSEFSLESAMAKVHCSDMVMKVTTDAVQLLGGYGYIRDYDVERFMRDAKITQIYDGTNQINRFVMAKRLLKRMRA